MLIISLLLNLVVSVLLTFKCCTLTACLALAGEIVIKAMNVMVKLTNSNLNEFIAYILVAMPGYV
ncbi:hypothetical protein CPS_1226 [Colwellia psychrerythraea 34H]|uniref:Uncharacterized protein n=1 Tax=Colwellia psychrerythraea (strain 34H / ATCC BAA-681) TaxID=167879 RepID=Q486P6_COLP3|nr:hypothetical protein CPS_1226 [Colwellia psychrerythraea 34H]